MPKISICIPVYEMQNKDFFLKRVLDSIESQTFKDYEIIITEEGKMAENANAGIKKAKGEIVKILALDDYLASEDSLQQIVDNWKGGWLVQACGHIADGDITDHKGELIKEGTLFDAHYPRWSEKVLIGHNTIGGMSVVAFENNNPPLYDENLSWLLDCVLYQHLFERYGEPTIVNDIGIIVGVGTHQMTHILTDDEKAAEETYVRNTYL